MHKKHYLAAFSAFFIWGFFSVPLKFISDFNPFEILFYRLLMAVSVLGGYMLFFYKKQLKKALDDFKILDKRTRNKYLLLSLGGGVLLTFNWLIFIYIVNEINVKTASFSYLICPVITAVLGFVILKEKLSTMQWFSVALCVFSCYLIGRGDSKELLFSLITATSYAVYLVTQRKNKHFDKVIILLVQISFSLIMFIPFYFLFLGNPPISVKFYGVVFLIASVFTVLPLFLNLYALKELNSATIGIMMYLNPIIGFFLGLFVFKEPVIPIQAVGYLIILFALVLFNWKIINQLFYKKHIV
jgi:chloramphenicol-sensitive protein RarD